MGKDCEESICIDKPSISKFTTASSHSVLFKQTEMDQRYPERPLYRTEFGNSTWKLLHRVSANYPDKPDESQKLHMNFLIKGISLFFPCPECAEHFRQEISILPPKLDSKQELASWFCYQHNQVNKRLGKEVYNCDNIDKLISEYKL
jgi:FAD-linked sulfhydryl oxidase